MTQEQLRNGQDLTHQIHDCEKRIKDIKLSLRELELQEHRFGYSTQIKIDRKDCMINSERLIIFLNKELETEKFRLVTLEQEFKSI